MCHVKFQVKKPSHAEGQRRESQRATARECKRAIKDQSRAHQGTVSSDVDMSTPGWPRLSIPTKDSPNLVINFYLRIP